MSEEPWYLKAEREAAERVEALLKLPIPEHETELGSEGYFDPWGLFPLYGSYSGDFDECALDVLRELASGKKLRDDLAAEMFREILCYMNLCAYGTSPRVCFPTSAFKELLPDLIEKWQAYSDLQWGRAREGDGRG